MKKSFMLVAAAFLAFAGTAAAQNSASTTGHASARVILPITIGEDQTLAFGGFFAGATSGTVDIATNGVSGATGTRTSTGGVTLYTGSQAGAWHQNEFSIEGEIGFTYTTVITNNTFNLTGPGSPMSCTMTAPVANGGGSVTVVGGESPDNDDVFRGGSLSVAAFQASGSYAGTFTYAVAYN
ncbi:MAG: DUF4402 domain-containing protein [Ignavibacteriota bacterium]